jgi:hypothetical protein
MKSDIGVNLDDNIARPDESFQELRRNAAAFSVIGDGLPDINIIDIRKKITSRPATITTRSLRINFCGNIPIPSQGNATTVSAESYQLVLPWPRDST